MTSDSPVMRTGGEVTGCSGGGGRSCVLATASERSGSREQNDAVERARERERLGLLRVGLGPELHLDVAGREALAAERDAHAGCR